MSLTEVCGDTPVIPCALKLKFGQVDSSTLPSAISALNCDSNPCWGDSRLGSRSLRAETTLVPVSTVWASLIRNLASTDVAGCHIDPSASSMAETDNRLRVRL
jgi:hypothetical protein